MSGQGAAGLRCLEGGVPPPGLGGDLRAIERLPQRVRGDFWEILEPNLGAHLDERAAAAVSAFCEARRITLGDVAAPVKACRYLLRRVARLGLAVDDLRADVRALCGEGTPIEDLLAGWYERALPLLRRELVVGALSEHGNLALGVDWRLDTIRMSQDGVALETPVVLMTFRYREGERRRRITLQLLPDVLEDLRAICNKIMT
jgi:hypothetical protein